MYFRIIIIQFLTYTLNIFQNISFKCHSYEDHSSHSQYPPTSSEHNIAKSTISEVPVGQPTSGTSHLAGSRIIDLKKLHDAIHIITQHTLSCQSPVELIREVLRRGLGSTLLARYNKCNKEIVFNTCNKVELQTPEGTIRSTYEANAAAVMGQMSVGGGHSNLEELMCTIGVPSISKPTFIDIERLLGSAFEDYLNELMLEAGRKERELAIPNSQYHHDVPAITVIVDGGWSKRSHGHSYNANSGVGVIFGAATKNLLYIGIKTSIV